VSTTPPPGGGPSPLLPLAYLVCAAVAFVAAATGTAWLAPELAGHYYHPRLLALTHTVTLGWITVAIMGASYQLVPVVLERPIWSERLARWQLAIVAVAVFGMVAHFYLATWPGLAGAAALLAVGILLYLLNIGLSLRGFRQWTFTARLVMLGYGGLAATTLFGLTLAVNHLRPFLPSEFFPTLHAHVQLALLGWVTPMILGVAARVYPMFFLAPAPGRWTTRGQLGGLAAGVPSVVAGLLTGVPALRVAGGLAVAVAALAHASWVLEVARTRKRRCTPSSSWCACTAWRSRSSRPASLTAMTSRSSASWLSRSASSPATRSAARSVSGGLSVRRATSTSVLRIASGVRSSWLASETKARSRSRARSRRPSMSLRVTPRRWTSSSASGSGSRAAESTSEIWAAASRMASIGRTTAAASP